MKCAQCAKKVVLSHYRVSPTTLISSYNLAHGISHTGRRILHTHTIWAGLVESLDAAQLVVESMHRESCHCLSQIVSSLGPFTACNGISHIEIVPYCAFLLS